jgi:hypothetical protein
MRPDSSWLGTALKITLYLSYHCQRCYKFLLPYIHIEHQHIPADVVKAPKIAIEKKLNLFNIKL